MKLVGLVAPRRPRPRLAGGTNGSITQPLVSDASAPSPIAPLNAARTARRAIPTIERIFAANAKIHAAPKKWDAQAATNTLHLELMV